MRTRQCFISVNISKNFMCICSRFPEFETKLGCFVSLLRDEKGKLKLGAVTVELFTNP